MHADGHPSLSSRLTANTRQAQYRAPSSNADVGASLVEAAEPRAAQGSAPSVQLPWRTRPSVRVSSSVETVDLRVDRDVPSLPHPSLPQPVAPSASPTAPAATATPLPPAAIYELALKYWCRGPGPNGPSLETDIRPVHPITPVSLGLDGASGPLIVPPVPTVSARGTLYFEPRTVIRVAARWKAHPDESVADVLRWLLQRGIPVVWRVQRPPGLTVFVPPASDPDDFVLQAWSGWESPSVRQYQSLMQALLARPHARQWILRGGLAWRLALHYGSAHLLQDAVSGPSPSVLVEGRGDQYDLPVYSVGDAPSDAENAALVGKTGRGSFWPGLAIWEDSIAYTGKWFPSLEFWFQRRLKELADGTNVCLSDRAWRRHIRRTLHCKERMLGNTDGSARRARKLMEIYPECTAVPWLRFPIVPASTSENVRHG